MDGGDKHHGLAAGSMGPVSTALRDQKEDDMFALAAYVGSLASPPRSPQAQADAEKVAMARVEKTDWTPARGDAPPQDALDRSMHACGNQITEAEIVTMTKFMRARFTEREPWTNLEEVVRCEIQRR